MNVKRFTGRSSREAMQKVRLAYGDNAVVLSTKPCSEGIEILAMAPETVAKIERFQDERAQQRAAVQPAQAEAGRAAVPAPVRQAALHAQSQAQAQPAAKPASSGMSTLSFQDYVRDRMLRKRQAELQPPVPVSPEAIEQRLLQRELQREMQRETQRDPQREAGAQARHAAGRAEPGFAPSDLGQSDFIPDTDIAAFTADQLLGDASSQHDARRLAAKMQGEDRRHAAPRVAPLERAPRMAEPAQPERRRSSSPSHDIAPHELASAPAPRAAARPRSADPAQPDMMKELRAMKGMIEERFGALAFMERMQKSPRQAQLAARLMECGFSPALIRKLVDSLPEDSADELSWAAGVLQRNLVTAENDLPLEDQGGVYALVGSTGVGKTTSTAKLAAAFATKHGAANLGLITLDAYRLGAHEQLRAYGRILGVPVHTAHDRVALEDLLELLAGKRLVLIDTAGLAQRDTRTRELLEMLSHRSIQRLLVVNAAAQGETIEDVLTAYKAQSGVGVVLSKLDEAVKLGPALDAVIRQRAKIVAVANGQRVPEDWHRLTAQALVHRALRSTGTQAAWKVDTQEVNLRFATPASGVGVAAAPATVRRSSRSPAGRSAG
ncbi:MAG: hypothetical protein RL722_2615 [Pseudomonadota bacterium]|jgi:flagellar biosynthesis protein FlhF